MRVRVSAILVSMLALSALLLVAGFYLLVPLASAFLRDAPLIGRLALSVHHLVYEPVIQRSGRDGVIGRRWFSGVSYWCERVPDCTIDTADPSEDANTRSPRRAQ